MIVAQDQLKTGRTEISPSPWRYRARMARKIWAGVTAVLLAVVTVGCGGGGSAATPGIPCEDGYTAHPDFNHDQDGCGPHGGARSLFLEKMDAFLAAYPDGPPSNYVCSDGWHSLALYRPGACSQHGGVASMQWPDGTQVTVGDDGADTYLIRPDGTRQSLDLEDLGPKE